MFFQFKKVSVVFICGLLNLSANGAPSDSVKTDSRENKNMHPLKKFYVATGSELIFSFGDQKADSLEFDNRLRFSLFPHVQQQYHLNFNKSLGFYTGISLINVGFRHDIKTSDGAEFELRQRSLSFGVPFALKIGDMQNGNYIALGASAEFMFHYKYKVYYNNEKYKYTGWFSDKVNLFSPSVFVDLRNKTGGYIRFKYYLGNFLRTTTTAYTVPGLADPVSFAPTQSQLFYISVGSTFMKKKVQKLTKDDV